MFLISYLHKIFQEYFQQHMICRNNTKYKLARVFFFGLIGQINSPDWFDLQVHLENELICHIYCILMKCFNCYCLAVRRSSAWRAGVRSHDTGGDAAGGGSCCCFWCCFYGVELFHDMVQSLANAIVMSIKRFSCKGINENGKAWRERIFAGSLIGEAVFVEAQGVFQIINDVLSNWFWMRWLQIWAEKQIRSGIEKKCGMFGAMMKSEDARIIRKWLLPTLSSLNFQL